MNAKRKVRALPGLLLSLLSCILLAGGLFLALTNRVYIVTGLLLAGVSFTFLFYRWIRRLSRTHHKLGRLLGLFYTVCLCLGVLAAGITEGCILSASRGSPEQDCAYVVVLGAGVNGSTPSVSLRDRLLAAEAYLNAHPDTVAVLSGGQGYGENLSEAQCMFNWLTGRGMDPDRLLLEDKSTTTRENLAFSLALLEARTGQRPGRIGILSSEYHLLRAELIARGQGAEGVGIPARTSLWYLRLNYFLREIGGIWYYFLF